MTELQLRTRASGRVIEWYYWVLGALIVGVGQLSDDFGMPWIGALVYSLIGGLMIYVGGAFLKIAFDAIRTRTVMVDNRTHTTAQSQYWLFLVFTIVFGCVLTGVSVWLWYTQLPVVYAFLVSL